MGDENFEIDDSVDLSQMMVGIVVNEVLKKEFKPIEPIVIKMSEASWVTKWYWRLRFRQAMRRLDKAIEQCERIKKEIESV